MPPQLRAVPRDPVEPPPPTPGDRSLVAGSDISTLVESLERQLRILELTSNGLALEMRKQPALSPLARYAAIGVAAVEQLQVDLLALIHAIRE